ncbi:putative toxin-antitoxin system toxin component, PIN family [Chloroflexi bacterium TSY]|nr:putative toxin-antitoxin system toxin component, PIN family [Chloroflexi bacterium TSY]
MLRVVLDTNLFVSSILVTHGLPAQAIQQWRERRYLLITSPALIAEIRHTLGYERIRRKYHVTDDDVEALTKLLQKDALVVPGTADVWGAIPDDPDDEHVLACAIDGQANLIASGDRHLLALGDFRTIPIVPVRTFLEPLAADD